MTYGDHDDRISEYLDGDAPDRVDLRDVPREDLARALLVDGVTRHLLSDADATADSVRSSMLTLVEDDGRRRRSRNRVAGLLAAAAAVLVAVLVYNARPSDPLQPLLDKVHGFVLNDDIDRMYRTSLNGRDLTAKGIQAMLYVRGTDRYASWIDIEILGNTIEFWQGSNGQEHWLIPPDPGIGEVPPVFVSKRSLQELWDFGDLRMVRQFAQGIDQMESSLRIFALLADLQKHYSVETTPERAEKIALEAGQVDITAYRDDAADTSIPDTIRMVVDEDTGLVRTVILKFVELQNDRGIESPFTNRRYDFLRVSDRSDYYDFRSHVDPDRRVVYK